MVFKFLKRAKSAPPQPAAGESASAESTAPPSAAAPDAENGLALRAILEEAPPRSITFVAMLDTAAERDRARTLLKLVAARMPEGNTSVIVHDFATGGLNVLQLPPDTARKLSEGVAEAIEMLSLTLPAAFESDSHLVARTALDEEVRSAHDTAIDALKQRAHAANIGLLPAPQGYAIAPMHDGHVVSADVFKALPDGLKAEVEAKLNTFETELSAVLAARATLQQSYAKRRRELDRDTAGLAVRAALAELKKAHVQSPEIANYLESLRADLIQNAALFLSGPNSAPRAPVEIATDPRLARYRIHLVSPPGASTRPIYPPSIDRAGLVGEVAAGPGNAPASFIPGALTRAGGGIVVFDAGTLISDANAWTLVRSALETGAAVPSIAGLWRAIANSLELPVDCRVVVTGSPEQYRALCSADPNAARLVNLANLLEPRSAGQPPLIPAVAAAA